MISDVWTIAWKEGKEILLQGGSRGRFGLLLLVGVFGIFLPLQSGRAWVQSPMALVFWAWVPLFLVTTVVADAFAGERERHTLETLLASRLSDRAILFGKTAAAVGYGWGLTVASVILGLVTVNLAHWSGRLLLYPPKLTAAMLALSLLVAALAASGGVLISLRAPTVRQAQQTMSLGVLALVFVPVFGIQALPVEWKVELAGVLSTADPGTAVIVAILALLAIDVALLAAAMARFQRARLILD